MWRWQIHLITKIYKKNDIVNCNAVRLYWTNPCIKNDLKRRMIEYSKWLDLVFLYAIHIFTRKSILLTPNFLFQPAWVFSNDECIKSNCTIFRKRFYCANYTKIVKERSYMMTIKHLLCQLAKRRKKLFISPI